MDYARFTIHAPGIGQPLQHTPLFAPSLAPFVHPYRLVFEPGHAPLPRTEDGGVDAGQVTAIVIVEVIDYH